MSGKDQARLKKAAASGYKLAIVTFKIGFKVYLMTDDLGVTARYPSPAKALQHLGKVRARAINSGFLEALVSDVLVDFRVHPASIIGDSEMGSAMQRFGQVCGVELGEAPYHHRMHYSGLEPKGQLKFQTERPRPNVGAKRKQLV